MSLQTITEAIRDIPDFPEPGIIFKDITPILKSAELFREVVELSAARYEGAAIDRIVAIDARGFIFGAALAYRLHCGLVPVRKKGKLPWKTHSQSYALEYGTNEIEIHQDAVTQAERVVIVDDLLATGGTARAAADLVSGLKAEIVAIDFVIELCFLNGRSKLEGYTVHSLIQVD